MKLRCGARTDVGRVREQNEDSYGIGASEQVRQHGQLLVVCDGMGGHAAGEVASRLAVDTILADYDDDVREDRAAALEAAFVRANHEVYTQGRGTMGTTGVAALLHRDALHIANVGDSRAYLIRSGGIRQISRDHSLVADQVAAGLLTPEQARVSMIKNVITRALGHQAQVTVDLFRLPLQPGDIVLLCSDGLHGLVTDDELAEVASAHAPDEAAQQFIALANARGGNDNITAVLVAVDELEHNAEALDAAAQDDPHERVTEPLPRITAQLALTTRPLAIEAAPDTHAASASVMEPAPPAAPPSARPAPPPAKPLAPARHERPLSLLGLLLSLILFSVLLLVILNARPELYDFGTSAPPVPTAATTLPSRTPTPPVARTAPAISAPTPVRPSVTP